MEDKQQELERLIDLCDGFLFTGGKDVEPSRYGEETKPGCGIIQKYRDEYELRVFKAALKTGKPILGICRGTQLINVGLGGTLYQDIPSECPSEIFHRQQESTYSFSHSVNIACGTPLYELVEKERIRANSFHHQSIKALGRNLAVMATADDGVIEAVYGTSKQYVRGYQWHPERLFDKDEENFAIFKDFISACQKSKEL